MISSFSNWTCVSPALLLIPSWVLGVTGRPMNWVTQCSIGARPWGCSSGCLRCSASRIPGRLSVPRTLAHPVSCSMSRADSCPHQIQMRVLIPSTSECDCTWRQGLERGDSGKMRSSGRALIPYNWCACTRGGQDTDTEGHREKMAVDKARRGGPNPAHTSITDFRPPERWENKCLLFKPPSLWYFVMAVLASEYILCLETYQIQHR